VASELAALAWSTGAQGGTLMATAVPETDKAMAVDISEPAQPQAKRRPDAAPPWQGMGAHIAQPAGGRPRQQQQRQQPQQRQKKKKKKGQKRTAVPHAAVGGASAPPPAKAKRFSFK
jgi:hypothetical protein